MIIISQDKSEIFNFSEIFRLYIDTWSSKEFATEPDCWCIRAEKASDNMICAFLGEYATEERAKEVLQEILERYDVLKKNTIYAQGDSGFTFNEHYYYEMPQG